MFLMHSMVDDAVPRSTEVPVEASALWKRGAPPGGPGKAEPLTGRDWKKLESQNIMNHIIAKFIRINISC